MNAARTIAGRPVRNGPDVAEAICDLVVATLDTSPHIAAQEVRDELVGAQPALSLLASGGHLANGDLVLRAAGLRLTIRVPVGEKALSAEDEQEAPRGAATADSWALYIPAPPGMDKLANWAAASCPHVSTDPPDEMDTERAASSAAIDLTRLVSRSDR